MTVKKCSFDNTPISSDRKCYICHLDIPRGMRARCPYRRMAQKVAKLARELCEERLRLNKLRSDVANSCNTPNCRMHTHKVNDSYCHRCSLVLNK